MQIREDRGSEFPTTEEDNIRIGDRNPILQKRNINTYSSNNTYFCKELCVSIYKVFFKGDLKVSLGFIKIGEFFDQEFVPCYYFFHFIDQKKVYSQRKLYKMLVPLGLYVAFICLF